MMVTVEILTVRERERRANDKTDFRVTLAKQFYEIQYSCSEYASKKRVVKMTQPKFEWKSNQKRMKENENERRRERVRKRNKENEIESASHFARAEFPSLP